ncbi:substrate-binding domain-containing protein [Nitrosococcus oceani]|uniref:substrate-binding domain-containing protein n=1 Tax=Nitrosococcus oceani TaxID=1229 RepID=UPI000AFA70EE|nr:substrate-binding domain-containing protein [Nitrosococcus oceani]
MRPWKCRIVIRFIFIVFIFFNVIQEVNAQEVVVNPDVPETRLTRNTLRAIFSMRLRTWPDGSLIKVFVLSDNSPLHIQFSKKILNIFPYQLRRTWDRLVYSGTGQAPIEVNSIKEMSNKVASTPGAIGYLSSENTNAQVRTVKIIQVKW